MKQHNLKYIPVIAALFLLFTGCEDMFIREIDVDIANFPTKLAVTATLDTDSGRLTLTIKEGHSLQYYKDYQSLNQTIIRNGTIRLFENDREIFSKTGSFDLSTGYDPNTGNKNGYYATFTNLSTIAGRTYRLEIDINGYAKATATAIMPDAPIISDATMDIAHPVNKKNIMGINSLSGGDYSHFFSETACTPLSLTIHDNSVQADYYALQMEYYERRELWIVNSSHHERNETTDFAIEIATPNLTLIQDNPDVECMDMIFDGEKNSLYSFGLMMLTDATFAGSQARLDLFALYNPKQYEGAGYYPKPVVNYDPQRHGDREHLVRRCDLFVTHFTQEAFQQYRSMALQLAGIGFFSEPVFIPSNIENAYGCFSVQNTVRIALAEFEGYHYSGQVNDSDFYVKNE